MRKPLRVLVVDDSALMRKLIPKILEQDDSIEVVGTAVDGHFALKKIEDLSPEVVTLDLEMPGLNGIDTLKQIMRNRRVPVIVVSSHSTAAHAISSATATPMSSSALICSAVSIWWLPVQAPSENEPRRGAEGWM